MLASLRVQTSSALWVKPSAEKHIVGLTCTAESECFPTAHCDLTTLLTQDPFAGFLSPLHPAKIIVVCPNAVFAQIRALVSPAIYSLGISTPPPFHH